MSKKIIYLLSLLMALILVFVSCKKAGTNPMENNKPPSLDEDNTEGADKDTGLFEDYEKIVNDKYILIKEPATKSGEDYVRNPVVVSMGKGEIILFAEKRWKSPGAANDVGIDGEHVVDVIYHYSKDGGKTWSEERYVNKDKNITTDFNKAHAAPVVFKKESKIIIAATSGSGIARTYNTDKTQKIDYIVGTYDNNGGFAWTDWKQINNQMNNNKIINDQMKIDDSKKFNAIGTQAGRGVVDTDGNLYFSVITSYQGTINDTYDVMSYTPLKGTLNNDEVTWEIFSQPQGIFTTHNGITSRHKEAKLITKDKFIVSPYGGSDGNKLALGNVGNVNSEVEKLESGLNAFGYFLTDKWYGKEGYAITKNTDGSIAVTGGRSKRYIFASAKRNNGDMYYALTDEQINLQGQYFVLDDTFRESSTQIGGCFSVDMLDDGTIIIASEEGNNGNGDTHYRVTVRRFSQKFLAEKTGN